MRKLLALPILITVLVGTSWAQDTPTTEPSAAVPAVVHWEIMSSDAEPLRTFYQSLFGWEPMVWETNSAYAVIPSMGEGFGIAGGIGQIEEEGFPPFLTFYVQVPDVDAAVALVPTLGGAVVAPVMEVPDVGRIALITGPSGNMVGLMEPVEMGEMPALTPSPHPVVHFEIGAVDAAPERVFYAGLLGWTYLIDEASGYAEIDPLGTGYDVGIGGGIFQVPAEAPPYVAVYVAVPDLQATLDAATALGATTIVPPMPIDETLSFAMFLDPQGFPMGIMHMQ